MVSAALRVLLVLLVVATLPACAVVGGIGCGTVIETGGGGSGGSRCAIADVGASASTNASNNVAQAVRKISMALL